MKPFALAILFLCALVVDTAESAGKKGGKSASRAKSKPKGAKKSGKGKKPGKAKGKGGGRGPRKKAGKPKASAAKRGGRAGKGGKKHGKSAAGGAKKAGKAHAGGPKKGAGKGRAGGPKRKPGASGAKGHKGGKGHFHPRRPGPGKAQAQKRAKARQARRNRALGRLDPAGRTRAADALKRARDRRQRARRPGRFPSAARKDPVKLGRRGPGLRLRGPHGKLLRGFAGPEKGVLGRVLRNRVLTPAERGRLFGLFRRELTAVRPNPPFVNALRASLTADFSRRFIRRTLSGLIASGGPGRPLLLVGPGGTAADPVLVGANGLSVPLPLGFDPGAPAIVVPENAEDPNGQGIVASLDPGSLGVGNDSEDPTKDPNQVNDPATDQDLDQPTLDSVWQTTRAVRLVNSTPNKLKVFVRYEAQNEGGEWQAYPPGEEDPLAYELAPGEACVPMDGDWRINARRVRIWAEGGGRKWERFKNHDLDLTPEPDQGYSARQPQLLTVAFR
jgi:hypothetical protein